MEKNISNYLKKPEQLEFDYYKSIGNDYIKYHMYGKKIIPDTVIKNKRVHNIIYIHEQYHINGFVIITEHDQIKKVLLNGFHPNCNYDTYEFCINDSKKNKKISNEILRGLITNFKTYYLDNCYYTIRYKYLKYEKTDSIYVNLDERKVKINYERE